MVTVAHDYPDFLLSKALTHQKYLSFGSSSLLILVYTRLCAFILRVLYHE
jgi:hypothetical protein